MSELLFLAESIARKAHEGQFRRDGVTPYIEHPRAVVSRLASKYPDEDVQAVGWLHDVLEDTSVTTEDLLNAGLPVDVVAAVVCLTKTKMVDYGPYLRLIEKNNLARRVKIDDMLHNLSDNPTDRQILKYAEGLLVLV